MNLIVMWLILLIIPVLFVALIKLIEKYIHQRTNESDVYDLNIELSIIAGFTFSVLLADMFFFFNGRLFSYYILFGLAGMLLELIADYLWLTVTGSRLFQYFKSPISKGFSSLYNFPYWAYAGIIFWSIWEILRFSLNKAMLSDYIMHFLAYSNLMLLIAFIVISLFKIKNNKIKFGKDVTPAKYVLLLAYIWGGVLLTTIHFNQVYLLWFFVWVAIIGIVLEGILGLTLRRLFGENHWIYTHFPLFRGQTSWLILPGWTAAGLLAILMFSLIGVS